MSDPTSGLAWNGGADAGGESAAALYSLIGTARLNGVDPEAYLRTVLSRIAEHLGRAESAAKYGRELEALTADGQVDGAQ